MGGACLTASVQGDCTLQPGHFIDDPRRCSVDSADNGVRFSGFARASKIDPLAVVDGVRIWPVDHWTCLTPKFSRSGSTLRKAARVWCWQTVEANNTSRTSLLAAKQGASPATVIGCSGVAEIRDSNTGGLTSDHPARAQV